MHSIFIFQWANKAHESQYCAHISRANWPSRTGRWVLLYCTKARQAAAQQWNNQINQIRPDKNALDYLIRSGWQRPIFVRKLPIFDLIWSGCICFFPAGGDIWSVSVFVYLLIHRTFFWRWPIFYLFLMRRWRQWTKNDASSHPGLMLLAYKY